MKKMIERISDHAINIAEAVSKMQKQELDSLGIAVRDIMNMTMKAFYTEDADSAVNVEPLEEVIDDLVMERISASETYLYSSIKMILGPKGRYSWYACIIINN